MKTPDNLHRLYTASGMELPELPWNQYPRPQLRRKNWICLNGNWDFYTETISKVNIRVPFCPESLLSGIENPPEPGTEMIYEKDFLVPEGWKGKRIILHFGAVSRKCTVYVNDIEVGKHDQAYLPFSVDITDALYRGSNRLRVSAVNDLSPHYPWGKQRKKRGGMWYTPVSGIWQTVWMEPVPEKRIRDLQIRTGDSYADIEISGAVEGHILFGEDCIPLVDGKARIQVDKPRYWSPEDPYLYPFDVVCGSDRASSYFALRTLSIENVDGIPRLCLNGKPYFFNGLLDQGYWSDGLYTPASPGDFENDIMTMKSLGYNTLRKHIKIEPELFYYACDRLGMVVFQDMINNGKYRYIRDTVLPTVGLKRRNDRYLNRDSDSRRIFLEHMRDTVRHLQNHPSICLWTIFNEGWGQFCADQIYRELRALDPDRFIDTTSGWFHQNLTDVESLHIYFKKLRMGSEKRPQLLSEFGGYSWKIPEHSFNLKKTYGYRKFEDRDEYVRSLKALYEEVAVLAQKGLSGAVYTQVSDVEDETNGLFTFDRMILKIMPEEILPIMEKLYI
ncbi:MAG: glycoside hydrolase family 2 [Eubacterium sp.]|nr:glycoside hydrolase family 2 [Eubacterium sp.]